MSETLVWWIVMEVVGLAALPICVALFRFLPDRGYTLSKAFGLLTLGYLFWILNVMRIMPNTTGGIWLSLLALLAVSGVLYWRRREEIESALRERLWLIAITEVVFFMAFVAAIYFRSYVPDLGGTEKPMDFMFLNAVTHGKSLPPEDPWLTGHSISYYYFGYLLVSIVTRLSGLGTGIGFNLGLAMIAALGITGAFGLVYNLAAPRQPASRSTPKRKQEITRLLFVCALATGVGTIIAVLFAYRTEDVGAIAAAMLLGPTTLVLLALTGGAAVPWRAISFGVLAALILVVMGNLEGVLEALAAHNVGSSGFWGWVNIDRGDPVVGYDSAHWWPDRFWFWWRATRILDFGDGIHEFPFFSFLLGDLHPHVMAMPFVLLATGVALNLFRSDEPLDLVLWLERPLWLAAFAIVLGGLAFLNTWDLPTMAFVVTLVALLRNRLLAGNWTWGLAADTAGFVLPLFIAGALAYTPFFFGGFASQASGFTAEGGNGSGLFHTMLIWGGFATIILPYAVWRISNSEQKITANAILWALAPGIAVIALWVVWDGLAAALSWLPPAIQPNEAHLVGNPDVAIGFWDRLSARGWNWLTAIAMGGSVGLLGLALVREVNATTKDDEGRWGHVFALALATTGALLVLGAEFIYIEDVFSRRLNTIFKLYYQAWILLSISSGYALYELSRAVRLPDLRGRAGLSEIAVGGATLAGAVLGVYIGNGYFTSLLTGMILGGIFFAVSGGAVLLVQRASPAPEGQTSSVLGWKGIWAGVASVVLIAGFVYPLLATYNRTESFDLPRGIDGLSRMNGDDQLAIRCLQGVRGHPVIAEALGGDYSQGGRISGATGLPTILQWAGHQRQWRGTDAPAAGRAEDLELLYTAGTDEEARSVVDKYGVRYVVVGEYEQETYPGMTVQDRTDVFEPLTTCDLGRTTIYRVRPSAATAGVSAE